MVAKKMFNRASTDSPVHWAGRAFGFTVIAACSVLYGLFVQQEVWWVPYAYYGLALFQMVFALENGVRFCFALKRRRNLRKSAMMKELDVVARQDRIHELKETKR